ncbi:MAG: VOC family protein [Planctomycetota bacterium]
MQINMLSVFTEQIDAMRRFYADVLGMEVGADLGKYVEFEGVGVRFALCERQVMSEAVDAERFGKPATGRPFSLAFACGDADELASEYGRVTAAGAEAVRPPGDMPWGQRAAFFADPDGNVHELFVA